MPGTTKVGARCTPRRTWVTWRRSRRWWRTSQALAFCRQESRTPGQRRVRPYQRHVYAVQAPARSRSPPLAARPTASAAPASFPPPPQKACRTKPPLAAQAVCAARMERQGWNVAESHPLSYPCSAPKMPTFTHAELRRRGLPPDTDAGRIPHWSPTCLPESCALPELLTVGW